MKRRIKIVMVLVASAVLIWQACKKPFSPESITGFKSALIVEGVINPTGKTDIYLSRTLDLDDKVSTKNELKAVVTVVAENNNSVTLTELGDGRYSIPSVTLNPNLKYRLKIKTSTGDEYESALMPVLQTPQIDSVNWIRNARGVDIFVNTHDAQNKTRYYQWEYEEDWEIRSLDSAIYRADGGVRVVPREKNQLPLMHTCYKSRRSRNILIQSTAQLTSDVVSRYPLVHIPVGSDEFSVRYSMNVKQYAISREAFDYLSMMKRNSEQQGSFFDAQPSELSGNIRNLKNPADVAIGFVSIAPVREQRIYIRSMDVPAWGFRLFCDDKLVANHPDSLAGSLNSGYIPHIPALDPNNRIVGWHLLREICLDCRTRGGGNVKPLFW